MAKSTDTGSTDSARERHGKPVGVLEQAADVYEPTPKATQKEAVAFLNKQLFQTPEWLLDKNVLNKITSPTSLER
ncbi:MAG: zinc-dependent metalloprotease, partial [Actinomycetota bacterium]